MLHILSDAVSSVVGCRRQEAVDCAVSVVSEQCGEEIAGYANSLITKLLDEVNCTEHGRQYPYIM